MTRTLLIASLLFWAAPAGAQDLALDLGDPSVAAGTLTPSPTPSREREGAASGEDPFRLRDPSSPGPERALLAIAGVSAGLAFSTAGAIVAGLILVSECGCDIDLAARAYLSAVSLSTLLTVPAGVFLFGNLGGVGADFGWTLLGALLGALPGATVLAIGGAIDEGDTFDPGLSYVGGGILAGLGLITGSIIAFELSSAPSSLAVEPGLGSVRVRGTF